MKRITRYLSLAVLVVLLLSAAVPVTFAQSDPESPYNTLTLSEAFLNATLQDAMQQNGAEAELYFDMQPGQFVASLSGTGPNGSPYDITLTIVPQVVDGRIEWDITAATLNDFEVDFSRVERLSQGLNPGQMLDNTFRGQLGTSRVESFVISDSSATLTWLRENPQDPVATLVDNLFSLTYSEARLNEAGWVVNPNSPYVSGVAVDLQPGQGIVSGLLARPGQEAVEVEFLLVPVIVEGRVQWDISLQVVGAEAGDDPASLPAQLANTWRAFFRELYSTSKMVDAVFTDTYATFTWDVLLEPQEAGVPVGLSDSEVQYTISEAELNDAFAQALGPDVGSVVVELQTGQAVLGVTTTNRSGEPVDLTLTLVGELSGGSIEWTITAAMVNGSVLSDLDAVETNAAMAQSWSFATPNTGRRSEITAFEISEDAINFTVRYR